MATRTRLAAACLVMLTLTLSQRSWAYGYSADIAYSTTSVTLIGYANTWKDYWNWDYAVDCISWMWSDEGGYCNVIQEQVTFAAVDTSIYRLSLGTPYYSGFVRDVEYASAGTTIAYPANDNWTVQGEHYAETHWWYYYCGPYNFCYPPVYGGVYSVHLGTSIDQEYVCGEATVDTLVREYEDTSYGVNIRPDCDDFDNGGGSTHFTWNQLNGSFADGNPHPPWGMVTQTLKYGLDTMVNNYANFQGIFLTSGYRCPHGNQQVQGAVNSFHVHGRAGDLLRPGWTQAEFTAVQNVALAAGAVETLPYGQYNDHHLHVAF